MTLVLHYAARSDVGLVRSGNEDSGYAGPSLLVVADGMGGHAAGELASAAAVATFAALAPGWAAHDADAPDAVLSDMGDGVARTTSEIGRVVVEHPDLRGMGTTLTAVAWHHGQVAVAHVGDSRAYQLRDGDLKQLTVDHTYVQMLVDSGRITPDEALTHARRNLIMRAIDGVTDVEPDLIMLDARAGDRLLLCSDGLSGVVAEDDIAALLGTGDPPYAAGALVEKALENGAPDNVTVVVAEVVEVDEVTAAALEIAQPVVVGAAGERRNRQVLSDLVFPDDAEPDPAAVPVDASHEPVEIGALPPPTAAATTAAAVDAEAARSGRHAQSAGRRRWLVPLALILGIGLLIAAGTTAAVTWAKSQYYVTTSDGKVAIYQGLTVSLPLVSSTEPYFVSDVAVTALPTIAQDALATPAPAANLEAAQRLVAQYASQSAACAAAPTTPGCPTPATPTPPTTPSATTSTSTTPPPAPTGSP